MNKQKTPSFSFFCLISLTSLIYGLYKQLKEQMK